MKLKWRGTECKKQRWIIYFYMIPQLMSCAPSWCSPAVKHWLWSVNVMRTWTQLGQSRILTAWSEATFTCVVMTHLIAPGYSFSDCSAVEQSWMSLFSYRLMIVNCYCNKQRVVHICRVGAVSMLKVLENLNDQISDIIYIYTHTLYIHRYTLYTHTSYIKLSYICFHVMETLMRWPGLY